MNLQRIRVVAYKEWREIVRDRLFFVLAFVVPSLLMLLFGFGLSLDVEHIPLAIVDYDQSVMSRDYAHKFSDSRYFSLYRYASRQQELEQLLIDNTLRAVIIIPPQFGARLQAGKSTDVQTWIDGTFPFRALTTKGYVTAINAAVNLDHLAAYFSAQSGLPEGRLRELLQPVKLETRYLYNQEVKSIWSLAPKLIMVILMLSPPFLTALGVVREKESGAIYNVYASTLTRGEYLLGKLLPYVAISMLNAAVLTAMALLLFGAPFKGDPLFFTFATMLYVICTTGIGLLVSVVVDTQVAAMVGTAIVTVVPAVLYSGMIIPIPSLSAIAAVIAHLLPGMYYAEIATGSFLKGVGVAALWSDLLVLALYAVALFSAGFLAFHKRPAH
ncbi:MULTISPECIES: ABC transporter permease [unclassified Undibacterium]|uniref:ABC transporter permease n=1 Tax=unclassified Undibacterium TaxID=2630295 RepID=UPI002AC9AAED|nr:MULTISPECIES: ABC transporter permease [unclassified Undibacterium]MEB0137594.1 ABC transporter permease [Undibacterium sp. CCC2.1]MEB0170595.1 ABC transporter permease [Undibacterium sp. CCC1.1]MEB0174536.1 ABC transporter permease [Undibacterium sp. CCC3.4]MEB0213667.1 ABC transporter permease [Undibacterium sp. 5I2]WPX43833.1 ABC transporter permease [Undibacterium sp. CCC3.4]